MASNWRKFLESHVKTISIKDKRVLDVGGSQYPIDKRIVLDNCELKILDLPQPHEVKRQPDIVVDIQDYFTVLRLANDEKKFDVVFCLEVSEYWHDPMSALKGIREFMKDGALLHISFHWLYPLHKPQQLDYLRYSLDGAVKILQASGFEVEGVHRFKVDIEAYDDFLMTEAYKPNYDNDDLATGGFIIKAKKL